MVPFMCNENQLFMAPDQFNRFIFNTSKDASLQRFSYKVVVAEFPDPLKIPDRFKD